MGDTSYFQLLNPIIMMIFSAGFFSIHQHDKRLKSAFLFGFSYLFIAMGFTLDFFLRDAIGVYWGSYISNVPLLASAFMMVWAFYTRYNRKTPWIAMIAMYVGTFAVMSYFLFQSPGTLHRSMAMNFGFGALLSLTMLSFNRANLTRTDKVIFWILTVTTIQFFLRPVLVFTHTGIGASPGAHSSSLYALTLHFTSAIAGLSLASALFFSLGRDLVLSLQDRSNTDDLTGIGNRRSYDENIDETLRRSRANGSTFGLIICDIDRFKDINDQYGHAVGDEVIRRFAKLLTSACRTTDFVSRIGGEEFALILPGATASMSRLVAESIRTNFEFLDIPELNGNKNITASFGVAEWNSGESSSELFKRADSALYRAKREGRNCVEIDVNDVMNNLAQTVA